MGPFAIMCTNGGAYGISYVYTSAAVGLLTMRLMNKECIQQTA